MGDVSLSSGSQKDLIGSPFLVKKFTVTAGNDATAINHGGPSIPDLVLATCDTVPTTAGYGVTAKTATTVTLDFAQDGTDTWTVYCWWFNPAVQDGSSINQDNDT